jgi:protease-4
MKQFFKFMLASMAGYFVIMLITGLIFFSMMVSLVSLTKKVEVVTPDNAVLTLKLDQDIPDRTSDNPFAEMNFFSFQSKKIQGLDNIIKAIEKAATEPKIKGIYLELSEIPAGIATLEEIRNALIDFKKSGKFIYAYSEGYSQKAYYLATAADKIYLNPQGSLTFKGLAAELMFFKGTLQKLDVQAQIIRHGKFKSAVEPFMNDKMSDANREQYQRLLDVIWKNILTQVSTCRNIPEIQLTNYADSLKVQTAEDALNYKMVDKLVYKDEMLDILSEKMGNAKGDKVEMLSVGKFINSREGKTKMFSGKQKIAVVYATGEINSGEGDIKTIGSEGLSKAIRDARCDSSIRAIVLRINSPGGSALASDIIWREVELAKKTKPVVVSMGDVAASGGYYIACGANKIFAQPNTLTGSIGVFGVIPNLEKFYNNKLGITMDVVKTNKYSEYITTNRALQPYETKVLTNEIENIYQTFIGHVAEGRKMEKAQVDSIGQGRVWSGTDAKRIGLVDEIGGLDKAIAEAAKLAGIDQYKLSVYPKYKDSFQQFIEDMSGNESEAAVKNLLGENYIYFEYLNQLKKQKGVQARMPFDMVIY